MLKGLKIVSVNIRSLYSSLDELSVRFKEFDIVCCCETWLNNTYTDQMVKIEGFELFRLDRESGNILNKDLKLKRGGGLIIYVKKNLSDFTEIIPHATHVSGNIEQLWIKITKPNVRNLLLGVIYRPPSGKVSDSLAELSTSLTNILDSFQGEITIVGDFNINYSLRHTPAYKAIKNFERTFNLNQIIKSPTRIVKNSKTHLDLIFTNMDHIISFGVLDIAISDHLPVFLIKKKNKIRPSYSFTKGRSYSTYSKEDFQNDIKTHPKWGSFWDLEENKPNEMWDIMLEIILETSDLHAPLKDMRIREDTPQWITKDLISEINQKDFLFKKAKKFPSDLNWETYKRKKNEVKQLLSTAKEEFIKGKLDEHEANPRKFWRTINDISGIGKNKNSSKCTKITDENNNEFVNQDAADFLNNYYACIGPNLAKTHKEKWEKEKCGIKTSASFSFQWVTEFEVKILIKEIKITKSSAIDGLSTRLLKDAFEVLSFELTYMYNSCLQFGTFPKNWGLSKITPIPKTNPHSTDPNNWRPISQICLPSKLLEKIIHNQLYHYLDVNNILSPNQYGFRKGLSTSMAIFDVLKSLYENWNDKVFSGCIFIDFSRAFDTIDHDILADKLILYGLDGTSQKLMLEYMSCRKHITTINGFNSAEAPVTHGTAQGSILGPLIFILYVNDIFTSLNQDSSTYMYADDTLILSKSDNIDDVTSKAKVALGKIMRWCEANKLSINYKKTKYMIVKHTKVPAEPSLEIGDIKINSVQQYEYLGMLLDDKLTMNEYADAVWKKANTKVGILANIRRFISESTAAKIYKSMIRPHLDYIDFVIDSSAMDRIKRLDTLQNKALRRIEYCPIKENRLSYELLQRKYNIEDLKLRRKRNLLKIIHANSAELENVDSESHQIELRSKNKINIKTDFTAKTRVYNSPLFRGARLWNLLPVDLQKEQNKFVFKKKLRTLTF